MRFGGVESYGQNLINFPKKWFLNDSPEKIPVPNDNLKGGNGVLEPKYISIMEIFWSKLLY